MWLTLVYAYTHTAAILAGSSLGSLTPLTALRRLPAALLFPHLLLSLPLALTLWALAEWGFWRLAGDRKGWGGGGEMPRTHTHTQCFPTSKSPTHT